MSECMGSQEAPVPGGGLRGARGWSDLRSRGKPSTACLSCAHSGHGQPHAQKLKLWGGHASLLPPTACVPEASLGLVSRQPRPRRAPTPQAGLSRKLLTGLWLRQQLSKFQLATAWQWDVETSHHHGWPWGPESMPVGLRARVHERVHAGVCDVYPAGPAAAGRCGLSSHTWHLCPSVTGVCASGTFVRDAPLCVDVHSASDHLCVCARRGGPTSLFAGV